MTDVGLRPHGVSGRRAPASRLLLLWLAFVAVHFWLGFLALYSPGNPFGDVSGTYKVWVERGLATGQWVGIDTAWVYPIVALVPMVISHAFGSALYVSTWLSLVMVIDAAAFAVLIGIGGERHRAKAAWWWLAFLVLLGAISLGRVDSVAIPIAMMGVLVLAASPRLASVLLTLAAWIKVWPAALVVAAVIAFPARRAIFWAAAITTLMIILAVSVLGGLPQVFSFITELTGRGIEIEAPMAIFWMFDSARGASASSRVFYDVGIQAYEVVGPGIATVGAVVTVLLGLAVVTLLGYAALLVRRGVPAIRMLPELSLALTTTFLIFNKVGSPQYATWLAVPLVLGLTVGATHGGRSFRVPAVLTLVIAALTQLIYPFFFDDVVRGSVTMLLVLAVRNLLYLALLGWAVVGLWELRTSSSVPDGSRALEPD